MILPQTETTGMKAWQKAGWKLEPLNIPLLLVSPPAARIDLQSSEVDDLAPIGSFSLIESSNRRTIDTLTHQALLAQSLRDYKSIWTTLAQR